MQTPQSLMQVSGLPRIEARMLLEFVLQKPRSWLLAHDTDQIDPEKATRFLTMAAHRRQGRPMAQLLGQREFMGYMFDVTSDVLIPRPETELLVEVGLNAVRPLDAPTILDLGTGSGAIAISLALQKPKACVVATDLSSQALAVAQQNAQKHSAKVQWWQGSWYEALPAEGRFDLIVSNPPYIVANDPHLVQGDLRFEPIMALTDGADGLSAIREIILGAHARLNPNGQIWLEHGYDQSAAVQQLLLSAGFKNVQSLPDLAGILRVTGGSL
ncbi:MAG TPA: peptide chain release factor N(5)-glutamine methyltransferase [Alcaligenaceae bacterium]|nr:peptide chain release factor N(5)-glutamine methyltransferase [Alcaligenaceae bacterium]